MTETDHEEDHSGAVVPHRAAELVVAALFTGLGVVLALNNWQAGVGWTSLGPESGAFPFALSILMALAGLWTFVAKLRPAQGERPFLTRDEAPRLARILLPSLAFIIAISWIGIYAAGFLFITGFLRAVGHFSWAMSLAVGVGVTLALFWVFEIQFQVFLPSGPIEAWLGF